MPWLSDLGISFSNTRVAKYSALFNELARAHESGDFSEFDKKYSEAEFVNATYERAELVRIQTLSAFMLAIRKFGDTEVIQAGRKASISAGASP